jgi:hypothetical protein
LPRSIRFAALAAVASALFAVLPATAAADTTVSPTSLDFGSVPVGQQSASQVVTVTQSCSPLDIPCVTGVAGELFTPVLSATSGFSAGGCPVSLVALILPQSCQATVSFVPGTLGLVTGLLSTGPGGPSVTLKGAGTTPSGSSPGTTTGSNGKKTRRRRCKHGRHHHNFFAAKKCRKHR